MKRKPITVIIPTWNSMPELRETLKSLKPAFGKSLKEVIIIDKMSVDETVRLAYAYGCTIIWDDNTLGHARLNGLKHANTKWIAFIDSDIRLPKDWYKNICKYIDEKTGWVYGQTKEDIPFIENDHEYKRQLKHNLPRKLKIGAFERGYTNNTIALREPLLDAPISNLNAWEDYAMTQWMIKKGYEVIEVPLYCDHLKAELYKKIGLYTESWGIAGELKAKGYNPRTLLRPFYFVYWGLRCTVHFKNFEYTKYYVNICLGMLKVIFKTKKEAFNWSR